MSRLGYSPIGTELLDDAAADPAAVSLSLRNLSRINRWFGGLAAVRFGLRHVLPRPGSGPVTLLDVGTGAGDIPRMARRWAADRGVTLLPMGMDLIPAAARLARADGMPVVVGCGGELPFADAAVDLVVLSQVAHHLDADSQVRLLREAARVARLGGVIADLRRSRTAAVGFRVGGWLMRLDPVTLRDGVVSLRRGFSRSGLRALLHRAGLEGTVRARPGARLVAWWVTSS